MTLAHLASALDGHGRAFEDRPGQRAMAEAVSRALSEQVDLVAEAGTGTGKTFAYLVPLLQSGVRAVLSTATRQLQTQIVAHDLPVAMSATGTLRTVAVLKGRSNYLCLERLERALHRQGSFPSNALLAVEAVARTSMTGERSEVSGVADDDPLWTEVTSTADNCLGSQCPHIEACFVARARRLAQEADLVVVNHHLLLADYALRERWQGASLLPAAGAIVIDEAHALADVATRFFGASVSERRLQVWRQDLARLPLDHPLLLAELSDVLDDMDVALQLFGRGLAQLPPQQPLTPAHDATLRPLAVALDDALDAVQGVLTSPELATQPAWQKATEALFVVRSDLQRLMVSPEPTWARWLEPRGGLRGEPIDVAPVLQRTLLAEPAVRVFTSATLTTPGPTPFRHLIERLGLRDDTRQLLLPGTFDYTQQALTYVPPLPDPFAPGRDEAVADELQRLATTAGGGTLALFSSVRAMRDAHARLSGRLPWTLLLQGEGPKERLLERFVAEQPAVLLATMGFWQGVDLPADSLRVVVMDKIPFPPPDDPLLQARAREIEAGGRSAFDSWSLPLAALSLRQGFGRLVRSRRHAGVVALLDPRLWSKSYGRQLLDHLPPAPRTRDFADVRAFLGRHML
jgi:ATP-dependent DNA helicase DinG